MIEISTGRLVKGCFNSNIPDNVIILDTYCFSYSNIVSIDIPSSVTDIRSNAFYYCSKLLWNHKTCEILIPHASSILQQHHENYLQNEQHRILFYQI